MHKVYVCPLFAYVENRIIILIYDNFESNYIENYKATLEEGVK